MQVLSHIGLVALGSAIGGLTRWGASMAAARWLGTAFPWGTMIINVVGSLFLGWFTTVLLERLPSGIGGLHTEDLRLLIAIGFTGSFTTFSTFEYESHALIRDSQSAGALAYIIGSVVLGLIAVHCGVLLARWR